MRSLTKSKKLIVIPFAFTFLKSVHATDASPLSALEDQLLEVEQLFSWVIDPETNGNDDTLINIDGLPDDAVVLDNQDGSSTLVWMPSEADLGQHEIVIHLANFNASAITSERAVRLNVATREEYRTLRATQLAAKTAAAASAFSEKQSKQPNTVLSAATISSANVVPSADDIAGDLIEDLIDQGIDQAAMSSPNPNDLDLQELAKTEPASESVLPADKNESSASADQPIAEEGSSDIDDQNIVASNTVSTSEDTDALSSTLPNETTNTVLVDSDNDASPAKTAIQTTDENTATELAEAKHNASDESDSSTIELADANSEQEFLSNDSSELALNTLESGNDIAIAIQPEADAADDPEQVAGNQIITREDQVTEQINAEANLTEVESDTLTGQQPTEKTINNELVSKRDSINNSSLAKTAEPESAVDENIAKTDSQLGKTESTEPVDPELAESTEPEMVPVDSIEAKETEIKLAAQEQIDSETITTSRDQASVGDTSANEDEVVKSDSTLFANSDNDETLDPKLAVVQTPEPVDLSNENSSSIVEKTAAVEEEPVITAQLRVSEVLVFAAGHSQEKSISIETEATEQLLIKALNTPTGADVKQVGRDAYSLIWKPTSDDKGQRVLILQVRDQQDTVITARRVKLIVE